MVVGVEVAGSSYALRSFCLLAVLAALAWGSTRLRARLLPDWRGSPARLAEAVIVVAVAVAVAQTLGSFGAFEPVPVLLALSSAAAVMAVIGRSAPARTVSTDSQPWVRTPRGELVAATIGLAIVAAQWATHVASALGHGMIHTDTLAYHAPFAANFVQTGWLTRLPYDTEAVRAHFPLNAEVVQAVFIIPYNNDVLAPFVNLGWAALGVLAAWCIGRRRGVGGLAVLGAALLLGLPTLAGTQPGQASTDVACAALLLSGVALVLERGLLPAPVALAGLATGLALGTKLNVVVPVAVLTIGVLVLALRARRVVLAALWCGGLLVPAGFWFVHNWIESGNPLPWYDIDLGPIQLTAVAHDNGATIANSVLDRFAWEWAYLPGLWRGLGRAWPLVLAVAVAGAFAAIARGRRSFEPVAGIAVLAGIAAHLVTPNSGGFTFMFNLRYLAPVLGIGYALAALSMADAPAIWRRVAAVVLLGVVVLNATAAHHEQIPAWPSGQWEAAVLAGAAVVGAVVVSYRFTRRARVPSLAALAALVMGLVLVGGWFVQRHYLQHRYVRAGLPLDSTHELFRDVRHEDVGVFGTLETYPMFGLDFSNRVSTVKGPQTGPEPERCRTWLRMLGATQYRYLVLTHLPLADPGPPEPWIAADPAATELLHDGDTTVYRIDGQLDPASCS